MAKPTKAQIKEAILLAKEEAKLRQQISASYTSYVQAIKDSHDIKKEINNIDEESKKITNAALKAGVSLTVQEKLKLAVLKDQKDILEKNNEIILEAIKNTKKSTLAWNQAGKAVGGAMKGLEAMPGLIRQGFDKIKGLGLLDMEKAIKTSALQMGVLTSRSKGFHDNIVNTAKSTQDFGIGIEELAEMQSKYSEGIGRAVELSKEGLTSMALMARATGLGAEGANEMAEAMDAQGVSAEKTGQYVQKALDKAGKQGLPASKVVKNIAGNIKLLNKYNFKDGVNGLTKMASIVTKMGVQMDFASGMADKLWDIEGAVDMSAQLQVMGGAWANLADPFKLMHMARNDMAGLTEEIGKAAAASMHMAKDGSITMSSMEMSRLKIIAKETGAEYDDLVNSGKNLYKLGKIKAQLGINMDDDTKEFISNKAEWKDGKATIMVKGEKKLVSKLDNADRAILALQASETKGMEERAKESRNFDEAITDTFNKMKISLLPLITVINEKLLPKIQKFSDDFTKNKWGEKIEKIATMVGEWIGTLAGFAIENPITTVALLMSKKIFDAAMWIANGLALSTGFNMGTAGGKGGVVGALGNLTKMLGPIAAIAGSGVVGGMVGKMGGKALTEASGRKSTKAGDNWGTGMAIAGGLLGLALAPFTGGASLAITAAAVGGGAALGGLGGKFIGDSLNQDEVGTATNDGLFGKSKGDFSKKRGVIQGGKVHPIDNKDDLLAMKKGGTIDKVINGGQNTNSPKTMTIQFEPIVFGGELKISVPGTPGVAIDLVKNQEFIRTMTNMIQSELKKQINGGKLAKG